MRRRLLLSLVAGLMGCGAMGCDRGGHPGLIGKPAPAFSIQDGGGRVSLEAFRGRIVVLHFWASWCTYCLAEFPPLTALQQRMPGIVVLAVSFDEDPQAYRQYLVDNHITLHTLLDASQRTNLAYGTTRPPETYIIDREGIVRRKFIGAQDWVSPEIVGYLKQL